MSTNAVVDPRPVPVVGAPSRPGKQRHGFASAGLLLLVAIATVLLVYPAAMLALGAFQSGPPGLATGFTFANIASFFTTAPIWAAITNSLSLAAASTALGMVLALALAYLALRTNAPLRHTVGPAMLLIFATPPLFYALGYSLLGNQYSGLVNTAAKALLRIEQPLVDVETWSGLLWVMTLRSTAFIYLFIAGPVAALDRTHEDAAYVAGSGVFATALKVNLGILMPAITGSAILAFLAGLQTFDTALVIAEPAKIRVIATEVFDLVMGSSPPRYDLASTLSLFLFVIVLGLVAAQNRLLGARSFTTLGGKAGGAQPRALRQGRVFAGLFIGFFLLVALLLPFAALLLASVQPFPGVYGKLTLVHYARAIADPEVWTAVKISASIAGVVGVAGMAFAMLLAMSLRTAPKAVGSYVRFALLLPRAMPGIVMGLAITWAYVSVPGLRALYGTIYILIIALLVVVVPFTLQAARASLAQVGRDLEEAALVSGASTGRMVMTVLVPLIAPAFAYGWFMAAVIVIGTLDIPLLLAPPTLPTLAAVIYTLNASGSIGTAAALLICVLVILTGIGAAGWIALKALASARRGQVAVPGDRS